MAPQDLTLAEYARVQAHVLERYPLEDVLSHLGLDERGWSSAEQTWKQRIASDPTLLPVYTRELDRAVDALERRITPLDDDAAAWLTFLAVYATQKEPFAWLERHGLGPNDVARLQRHWARRCRDDGDVAKRFGELEKDAAGRPLPNIVVDPRRPLRRGSRPGEASPAASVVDAPSGAHAAHVDLDGTAELSGQVLAVSLPFRAATPQDAERMAQRRAESSPPPGGARSKFAGTAELPFAARALALPFGGARAAAGSANLDGTVEASGAVLAPALPFAGTSSPLAAPEPARPASTHDGGSVDGARGSASGGHAIVTMLPWRDGDGRLRTTIVGKLCVYLQAGAPPVLVPSDPLVAFDRLAADRRFVEAASEMAPWAVCASIITYGGPLRFTFHPANGEPLHVTAVHGAPVGRSMSNPERAQYAPNAPKRGPDGILTIPEGFDGRYFVATPPGQHPAAIVGNERVVLEVGSARYDTTLPANVIVVAVQIAGQSRQLTLPFDTLAVHGDRRRIALIGRATLPAEATLLGHRLASLHGAASPDPAATPARRVVGASTAYLPEDVVRAAARPVMPFESRRSASDPNLVPPAPPPPPPDDAPEQAPAKIERPPAPAPKPAPKPVIARPKPGAMAKPRIKKR